MNLTFKNQKANILLKQMKATKNYKKLQLIDKYSKGITYLQIEFHLLKAPKINNTQKEILTKLQK